MLTLLPPPRALAAKAVAGEAGIPFLAGECWLVLVGECWLVGVGECWLVQLSILSPCWCRIIACDVARELLRLTVS